MRGLTVGLLAAAVPAWGDAAGSPTAALRFTEVARTLGVDFVHRRALSTRLWFPEIMSGGGGWLDYDGDGDLDLYLVQGGELDSARPRGPGDRLFRNDGASFRDVSERALGARDEYGMGLAAGDYDGDGDGDLYLTNVGPNVLLRNNGDGTFSDVTTAAGVGDPGWGTSAAFLDYDGDGRLDLFVVNYIHWSPANEIECFPGGRERDYCHPNNYNAPAADVLYRNLGDGRFEDVTRETGIAAFFGNGLGVAVTDVDGNGRPDLYVANDGMPNQLWINVDGRSFVDDALLAGCAVNRAGAAEAGMGVVAADLDGDLDTDLLVTHLRDESHTLYVNRGTWFDDQTAQRGLAAPSIGRTGFGVGAADFDHDGRVDLAVVNGRVGRDESAAGSDDPFAEPNQLFRGLATGGFAEVAAGLESPVDTSRAAAFGDYDGDGRVDLLVVNSGGSARVYRNAGAGGAWLRVRAVGAGGGELPGTEIDVLAGGRRQRRRAEPAYGYCATNDPGVHFGLAGARTAEALDARWPDGRRQRWLAVPSGRVVSVYR